MKEEIEWTFDYWTHEDKQIAAVIGIDANDNKFIATCKVLCGEFINFRDLREV